MGELLYLNGDSYRYARERLSKNPEDVPEDVQQEIQMCAEIDSIGCTNFPDLAEKRSFILTQEGTSGLLRNLGIRHGIPQHKVQTIYASAYVEVVQGVEAEADEYANEA
jgi:hypothetical protein